MITRIKIFIAIAWLAIIGLSYFRLFPLAGAWPAFPPGAERLPIGGLTSLLCLALIVVAANGWGKYFWEAGELSKTERFVFATGAGYGFLSLFVLFGNLFSFVNPLLYFALLLTGFVLFIMSAGHIRGGFKMPLVFLLAGAFVPLGIALIGALAPPTQFDSLVYHLALPARYIAAGKMYAVPHNFYFSFPQNGEMIFQLAMMLESEILANLIAWSCLLLTGLTVFAFTRRYFGSRTAVVAGMLWFCTPSVMLLATGAYVDLFLVYYVILAVFSYMLWTEQKKRAWLIAAGIFAGFALGTKYSAGAAALILCVLVIIHEPRQAFRNIFSFVLPALIVFLPWMIKNILFLKNPIVPWGAGIFGSSLITPDISREYFSHIWGRGLVLSGLIDSARFPLNLAVSAIKYCGGDGVLGPAFLLFVPLLLLRRKIDRITKNLLMFCVLFCILLIISGNVTRFLVTVVPFLCILAALGFAGIASVRWRAVPAYILLVVLLLHNLLAFHRILSTSDPYSPVMLGERREEYLERTITSARAIDRCVNGLGRETRVLFLGETRGYYCSNPAVVPTAFDRNPLITWANEAADYSSLAERLREARITHVLENEAEFQRLGMGKQLTARGLENWRNLKLQGARTIYSDPNCHVYEINI